MPTPAQIRRLRKSLGLTRDAWPRREMRGREGRLRRQATIYERLQVGEGLVHAVGTGHEDAGEDGQVETNLALPRHGHDALDQYGHSISNPARR
jgi:hypothetical protein